MASHENPAGGPSAQDIHKEPQPRGPFSTQPVDSVVVLFFEVSPPQGAAPGEDGLHKEKTLSIIGEFGGKSSGTTQNSVRAYFSNGKEALKAAVKIQQHLLSVSPPDPGKLDGRGRIGVHFTDTLSKGNTVSDVIGMATRLARGAGPSQIYVSQPVHDIAADLQGVHFEPVSVLHKAIVWDGPPVYSVNWEKTVDYKPGTCIVLYFRPVQGLGDGSFPALWSSVVREDGAAWGNGVVTKLVLTDNSLALVLNDGKSALGVAHNLLRFLWDRIGKETEKPVLPVQAFAHLYDRAGDGSPVVNNSDFPLAGISPGTLHVSTDAFKFIKNQSDILIASGKDASPLPSWHKVLIDLEQDNDDSGDFLYREALGTGGGSPCFYCGSRRHKPGECPSKHLPDNTRGLEKLGHLSVKETNSLFQKFLAVENQDPHRFCRDVVEGRSAPLGPALHAFYDLNRVLQLRFFRTLFYAPGNEWGKKADSSAQSKGGQQWLALDSLRVSEVVRAEALLKEALAKHPEDYRIYCTLGYVYVERGDLVEAEYFLKKALKYTKVNTAKIFVHFLLAHINGLLNRVETAHRNISDILALDPGCPEALYQDVLFRLRQGDEKGGLQRLSVLISDHRKYYVQILIDPVMTPFQTIVNGQLKALLNKVKEEAETLVHTVDQQLANSTALLQGKDLQEVRGLRSEIQSLLVSRSYFGYLDVISLGDNIIKVCANAVQEQKREARALLDTLNRQVEKDMAFVLDYSFPRLINAYYRELEEIRERILSAMEAPPPASPEELGACVLVREELRAELARIETEFAKLEGWRQILFNGMKFVKNFIIILTAVLLLSIFVVPLSIDFLNRALSGFDVPRITDVALWQKSFTLLGGAGGLVVSFLLTTKTLFGGGGKGKKAGEKGPVRKEQAKGTPQAGRARMSAAGKK